MAKQHFYSRVPARGSLFNRSDGFDTFAQSEGLSREFVERELSAVYENKLGKQDAEAVRTGKMPVVYSQCCLRSGQLVQSCVTYLPKDYTGERSAYLCHSLILSDEEKQRIFCSRDNALLNPAMFVSDAGAFDFVNQSADPDYPEKEYIPGKAGDPKELLSRYEPNTLKGFLFALLSVLCAKGKTVYFKMPCEDGQVSAEALKFMDQIASVVPYHLRKDISFASYVTDPAQYSQVKIKCVSADCPETLLSKGIFIDFGTDLVAGMPNADAVAKMPVSFFYSLLEDATIRNEFLLFVDKAVKAVPELEKLSAKTLSDLVFLFGGASGLYDQEKTLPTDDNVLTFLSSYEKYRAALDEERRRNAYRCLERYPQRHVAIPKNIFAKLTRIYPTDVPSAKRIVMNVVLELIHTDVMRDKLFTFLKSNYADEDADIRKVINADLCRVFYGGFLQAQILTFFGQNFATEPEETQNAIFDKLMLSIRTVSVQEKILAFIGENYSVFSEKQKARLYEMIFEMLPECDALSAALVGRLNAQMRVEDAARREQTAKMLAVLLAADYKKKEHKLMPLLCAEPGFCQDVVIALAFGSWNTRKIYEEYMERFCKKPLMEKTRQIVHILDLVPGETTGELLTNAAQQLYEADAEKTDLYGWMEADELVQTEIARRSSALAEKISANIMRPAVLRQLNDALNVKLRKDGLQQMIQYAQGNLYLQNCPEYQTMVILRQLMEAIEAGNAVNAYRHVAALLQESGDKGLMANYLEVSLLNWTTQTPEKAALCQSCCSILKEKTFFSEDMYAECKSRYSQTLTAEDPKLTGTKLASAVAESTANLFLRYLVIAAKQNIALLKIICQDKERMEGFLRAYRGDNGKSVEKAVLIKLENAPIPLREMVDEIFENAKPKAGGFFGKLFGKK